MELQRNAHTKKNYGKAMLSDNAQKNEATNTAERQVIKKKKIPPSALTPALVLATNVQKTATQTCSSSDETTFQAKLRRTMLDNGICKLWYELSYKCTYMDGSPLREY